MKIREISYCSFNAKPGSCSRFPGLAKCEDGKLVLLYDDAENCECTKREMRIAFSHDGGRSWTDAGRMYEQSALKLPHLFSENCKPVWLGDDELLAVGFGFEHDQPQLGLAAYAEKHGRFPASHNTVSRSLDCGKSWTLPRFIDHSYPAALELSGPALWCRQKNLLLAFGPPFLLKAENQKGVCLASRDRGESWHERGVFFRSSHIAPWEVRALLDRNLRLWLVIWAYDLKAQKHLNNHVAFSDDYGLSWSRPCDIGIPGQAANLFEHEDKLYIVFTKREGSLPGIYIAPLHFSQGTEINSGPATALWLAPDLASAQGNIAKQFRQLKFGQPSMTRVGKQEWLLLYWSCEGGVYSIRSRVFVFE